MKAVIMAGGSGTRLRPLTCSIPKPMVPVVNRPMMEHILNLLKRYDIKHIANTLWYLPDEIMNYFDDGSDWNVQMEYFIENKPLGTAGSVKNAQSFLNETFIVVSGDSLTDIDLSKAIQYHKRQGAVATLVLTRVANPLSYGVVIIDENGKITQFLEKPSWSEVFSDTVNTGIYILEPEVLDEFDADIQFDFSKDLFPKLLTKKAPLYGYVAEGYWSDVGTLEVYRQAQQDCLKGKLQIEIASKQFAHGWIEPGVKIAEDVNVEGPVYIGENSTIENGVSLGAYTVIGSNCQIGSGSSLKRTTLWSGVNINRNSQIRGAILASKASIQDSVNIYEGVVIGEKTSLGAKSSIAPNVKIWPAKKLSSGSRIQQSLVWGHQEDASLFTSDGIKGDLRGNLTPEVIVKLGSAFGEFIKKQNTVLVTNDKSKQGKLAKRSLIAGLLSSGLNVYDGGTVSGNLTRYAVSFLQANAGLHCQQIKNNKHLVNIQCWDASGLWLAKADARKIENIMFGEEYARLVGNEIGDLSFVPGLLQQYVTTVAQLYRNRLDGAKIALEIRENTDFAQMVKSFLQKAGCTLQSNGEFNRLAKIIIYDNSWTIEDENGEMLDDNQLWALYIKSLQIRKKNKAAVPIDASQDVLTVAGESGMNVTWTKRDPRGWMEIASELGNTYQDDKTGNEFFPNIEPLVSIGEIIGLINKGKSLAEIKLNQENYRVEKTAFCPWQEKGRVMRRLINEADPSNTDFLDGIKHYTERGWALVIPDGDDPVFRVFTEGYSKEEADALADHYLSAIQTILYKEGAH